MSEQNRYQIEQNFQRRTGEWGGWTKALSWKNEDTWQDTIHQWIDDMLFWWRDQYTVVSEKPSEDGRSGIIEIQVDLPNRRLAAKIKATLIDAN